MPRIERVRRHVDRKRGTCLRRGLAGAAALAALGAGRAAEAQTETWQSVGTGRFVASAAGFPALADARAPTRFRQLYLGNGQFVLQDRSTGLCLAVVPELGDVLAETAKRNGDVREQFSAVAGASPGSVALLSRLTGEYVAVQTATLDALAANSPTVTTDASFVATDTDPNERIVGTADLGHRRQTIFGFGGALVFNEYYLADNPYRSEIFHALFDPTDGLGITYLRIGNDYGISETDAGGYADFNQVLVNGASAALGAPVGVIMSGWGPPAYLKSNGSTTAGTLRTVNGQYDYAGFAQWWADSIAYWRTQGIDPSFVSIQNEPEVDVSYISNHFNPVENVPFGDSTYGAAVAAGYGPALDAVSQAFKSLPSAPALIGPEIDGLGYDKLPLYMAGLKESEIAAIAHHLYDMADSDEPDSFDPLLRSAADTYSHKPKFMTEWYSNDPPIVEAEAMHDTLVTEGVNAYIKWSLANSATVASAIYEDDPTKPPSTWLYPHGWHVNDNYYVTKHYAYFVRPGFQRVDTYVDDPDLRVSAFVDPHPLDAAYPRGVMVVLNTSATRTIAFVPKAPGLAIRSVAAYRTSFSGTERWNDLGAIAAGQSVTLPPDSILTVAANEP